jgi:hypothetical protein
MTARDFIQNQLLPFSKQMHAWKQVPAFIESKRHLWDKPDTGVVDVEAMDTAAALYDEPTSLFEFVQAYEQAKLKGKTEDASSLAKVRGSHDGAFSGAGVCQPMPTKLDFIAEGKKGVEFTPEEYLTYLEWQKAQASAWKNRKPLPALPEKRNEYEISNGITHYGAVSQNDMNQLISCLAAVYEEINRGKTI